MAWCIWTFLILWFALAIWSGVCTAEDSKTAVDRLWSATVCLLVFGTLLALLYFGGAFHAIGLN